MGVCPTCGRPLPVVKRSLLRVHPRSNLILWGDQVVPLTEAERRLVKTILEQGSARWEDLQAIVTPGAEATHNLVAVTLSHARRKLRQAGVTGEIKAVRGWGVIFVDTAEKRRGAARPRHQWRQGSHRSH